MFNGTDIQMTNPSTRIISTIFHCCVLRNFRPELTWRRYVKPSIPLSILKLFFFLQPPNYVITVRILRRIKKVAPVFSTMTQMKKILLNHFSLCIIHLQSRR